MLDPSGQITDVSPDSDRLVPLLSPAQAAAIARNGEATLLNGPAVRDAVADAGDGGARR